MSKSHYNIYFLYNGNIPSLFLRIGLELKKRNINLIPVQSKEIGIISNEINPIIFFIEQSLAHKSLQKNMLKGPLAVFLNRSDVFVIHLSSFSPISSFLSVTKKNRYFYFQLPISISEIVEEITQKVMLIKEKNNLWEGGKSPRMSSEIIGN